MRLVTTGAWSRVENFSPTADFETHGARRHKKAYHLAAYSLPSSSELPRLALFRRDSAHLLSSEDPFYRGRWGV